MNHPIVKITPEQFGYKDRGKLKWMGMMLSDHSEALKREKENSTLIEPTAKEEMSEYKIAECLYKAFIHQYPVCIQANSMKNGCYYQDIECKVIGSIENQVHLLLKDGRSTHCTLAQIRHVHFMDIVTWYNKEVAASFSSSN